MSTLDATIKPLGRSDFEGDPDLLLAMLRQQELDLAVATRVLRHEPIGQAVLLEAQRLTSALEATQDARCLVSGDGGSFLARCRAAGGRSADIGRLARRCAEDSHGAAYRLYSEMWEPCERCDNLGYSDLDRGARCRCVRGRLLPAFKCHRCQDSGWVEHGEIAERCSCQEMGPPQIGASTPLVSVGLVWSLPQASQRQVQVLLSDQVTRLAQAGVAAWIMGGQETPRPGIDASRYAGTGVAWLCARRLQAAGLRVREMDPLDLIAVARLGRSLISEGEVVLVRTVESAVPTPGFRQTIERLLDEAHAVCGSVLISSRLPLEGASAGGRTPWHHFVARAVASGADLSSLREALRGTPGDYILGEVSSVMLNPLSADDYLTDRARLRMNWLTPDRSLADDLPLAA